MRNWIMKTWLTPLWGLIGFLLGAGLALAAAPTPGLQLSTTDFDFGEVAEGATVSHAFVVKNTGPGVLKIINVRPG